MVRTRSNSRLSEASIEEVIEAAKNVETKEEAPTAEPPKVKPKTTTATFLKNKLPTKFDSGVVSTGLEALRKKALSQESKKMGFAHLLQKSSTGGLPSSFTAPAKVAKRGRQPLGDAGEGWFGMKATPMTEELKKDLMLIRNRGALQPTKFYKSSDPTGPIVQLGTVIEGPTEYYSSRLTKKQRRTNMVDEILADSEMSGYAKKKYKSFQQEQTRKQMERKQMRKKKKK